MRKTTFMKIVKYNITRVWTVSAELPPEGSRSAPCTALLPRRHVKAAKERHVSRGLNTRFHNPKEDSKLGSLSPITNRASFLLATKLTQNVDISNRQYSSTAAASVDVGGIVQIELAQTGEGIADCELLHWFVQEGDEVDEFQPLCEVQSDKASVEITSRYKGKVSRVNFLPGDIVKVGEALVELIVSGETNFTPSATCAATSELKDVPLVTESSRSDQTLKVIQTTPAVRHLAKSYGVNLADVPGSGKDGRILKDDVLRFALSKEELSEEMRVIEPARASESTVIHSESSDSDSELDKSSTKGDETISTAEDIVGCSESVAVKPATIDLSGSDKIILVRGFRRIMAKTMTAAVAVPHFHYTEDINVDALVQLKGSLKNVFLEQGVKITYLPFLLKALSIALQKYPLMNSTVNQDVSEITVRASHNIGVGMATSGGLVVPNIKNVQQLSVSEIAEELARLSQLAVTNRLCSEDVTGGTITVSNVGSIGGKYGSPVLNVPEVAIVAIGRMQKLPRYAEDGSVYPANIMGVTWGADHRVVDGATVASFCNQWKLIIEQPALFLFNMR